MILLWGIQEDSPLRAVRAALERQNIAFVFLDQCAALETDAELKVGAAVEGCVQAPGLDVDLGAVTAAYLRPHDSRRLPAVECAGAGSLPWIHACAVEDMLLSWSELTAALVVNRPSAMATNSSKPFQAMMISARGFDVPETLITTDPRAVQEFCGAHGAVIYKSISGVRSIVARLDPSDTHRLPDVAWCPTQFQQYIAGCDYRVHIVGEEIFACEIVSEAADYRYAHRQGKAVSIQPCGIPQDIADRCKELADEMELVVAGVDLRRTPEGRWYCFEVNPSPGFTYYEAFAGQPIAAAVARLLARGAAG